MHEHEYIICYIIDNGPTIDMGVMSNTGEHQAELLV